MKFLLKILLLVIGISGISYFIPEIHVNSVWTALGLIIVMALLNIFIKPLLILFTIPITIFTFGLFLLVINTIIVLMADWILEGFWVTSFGWAFLFSILLSFLNYLIDNLLKEEKQKD